MRFSLLLVCVAAALSVACAINNGVARTPAMGYNTWNDFRCTDLTASNIKIVADKIVELGLHKLGYEYVNIDDCWAKDRDPKTGRLVADPKTFPEGIKPVADYVHSKGMKFGIYTDRGNFTCAGRPASGGHETIDAETFASWGVDYLKEDSCNATQDHTLAFAEYGAMRDALNATGRPIYFSLCGWAPWYAPEGQSLGNSWRIAGDCNTFPTIYAAIMINRNLAAYAGPGGWNDPDMLVGSTPGAASYNTPDQARTQFSLWSIMAAPLLIGSNIRNMSAFDLQTYSNTEVIAIDQDPLGKQGKVVYDTCPLHTMEELEYLRTHDVSDFALPACQQIWVKPLANGDFGVNMVNFATEATKITCDAKCFAAMDLQKAHIRDVWEHKDLGLFTSFIATVGANGASLTLRFSKA